jgi:predicted nucleic acid-binding protein
VLVYCDTNVYCRPFDDQSQPRIKAETDAFLGILERAQDNRIALVSSDILVAEVRRIPDVPKRRLVELYLAYCAQRISATLKVVQIADELVKQCQLKPKDAFHIASACEAHVPYCLTCDDRVTNKNEPISETTKRLGFEVKVLNPLEFLAFVDLDQQEKENNHAKD